MTTNKKRDRSEDKLIRIGGKARTNLGLEKAKEVELWPRKGGSEGRIHRARLLTIHEAFTQDLKEAKAVMPEDDFLRVGFVTSNTFSYICGHSPEESDTDDIWLADELQDIVIGADPEFLLAVDEQRNRFRYAGKIPNFSYESKLGSDGPWAELRPDPEIEVKKLVKNMKNLLKNTKMAKEVIKEFYWLGGCYYKGEDLDRGGSRDWPIGGHIHLGSPIKLISKISKGQSALFARVSYFSCLKHVLDELVAIPLLKLDGAEEATERRRLFGSVADLRTDHSRLEWRTPSGMWLIHPRMAEIVIGVTKGVTHEFFKILEDNDYDIKAVSHPDQTTGEFIIQMGNEFGEWDKIKVTKEMKSIISNPELIKILNKGQFDFDDGRFINALRNRFKKLSVYKEYAEYMDQFIDLLKAPREEVTKERDLKKTWLKGSKFILD